MNCGPTIEVKCSAESILTYGITITLNSQNTMMLKSTIMFLSDQILHWSIYDIYIFLQRFFNYLPLVSLAVF